MANWQRFKLQDYRGTVDLRPVATRDGYIALEIERPPSNPPKWEGRLRGDRGVLTVYDAHRGDLMPGQRFHRRVLAEAINGLGAMIVCIHVHQVAHRASLELLQQAVQVTAEGERFPVDAAWQLRSTPLISALVDLEFGEIGVWSRPAVLDLFAFASADYRLRRLNAEERNRIYEAYA